MHQTQGGFCMYQLTNFTQNITPFIEGQSLKRFMLELEKIPNCQERFQNLIKADSEKFEIYKH